MIQYFSLHIVVPWRFISFFTFLFLFYRCCSLFGNENIVVLNTGNSFTPLDAMGGSADFFTSAFLEPQVELRWPDLPLARVFPLGSVL